MTGADVQEFWDLIKEIDFCMLTTAEPDGLVSRPLTPHVAQEDGAIHFIVRKSVYDRAARSRAAEVNLAFVDVGHQAYVSVTGTSALSQDLDLIERLWTPFAGAYFDQGAEDPDVAVLTVTPRKGEYWESRKTVVGRAFELIKVHVAGGKPDMGENREVRL